MIVIKNSLRKSEYQDDEIYPWGFLNPGAYREVPGCCSGCQAALERGEGLCEGHFACSVAAFDAVAAGAVEVDTQLLEEGWVTLLSDNSARVVLRG